MGRIKGGDLRQRTESWWEEYLEKKHERQELHAQRAAVRRKMKAFKSVLKSPPQMAWPLQRHSQYAAFLSHYKVGAGMEARYLRDILQMLLGVPQFLDSQELTDIRDLISTGLLQCDVLVLLATHAYFLRPYCLVEIWCALHFEIPIVVLEIAQRGFDWTEAQTVLSDLEAALDEGSCTILRTSIESVKKEKGETDEGAVTVRDVGLYILEKLRVAERIHMGDSIVLSADIIAKMSGNVDSATKSRRTSVAEAVPRSLRTSISEVVAGIMEPARAACIVHQAVFHPWGTDNELMADVCDVVDLSASSSDRPRLHSPRSCPRPAFALRSHT